MSGLVESWVESANDANGNFPLNNLPFGVFSVGAGPAKCATAIGDFVVDLSCLENEGLLDAGGVFETSTLNAFMKKGPEFWQRIRDELTSLFGVNSDLAIREKIGQNAMIAAAGCEMHMPFRVSEYTDFYACRNHATNVGTMFRGPENALSPNWLHIPIGYNGRASTVVVSGTDIHRPCGQLKGAGYDAPVFAPSRRLDIELEIGAVIGGASVMGSRLSVKEADAMIFGYVLLNDWSARDVQAWEGQPLGPFQAKAFATSISPWVITSAALEPFRTSPQKREIPLLDYLHEPGPMLYDIDLEIEMQASGSNAKTVISRTNYREMYYSSAQQLAHHSSSGCAMNVGDLLGSGTISGTSRNECGSLLEMTWGGKEPLALDCGHQRTFVEDGDTMTLRGHAQGEGYRIGFGECRGTILPAVAY